MILMGLMFAAGGVGLNRLASRCDLQHQNLPAAGEAGAGVIVRSELLCLWLPEDLLALAASRPPAATLENDGHFRRYLELHCREDLWYVTTFRLYRRDGKFDDISYIRQPCGEMKSVSQLREHLRILAKSPAAAEDSDQPTVDVRELPQHLLKRKPRNALIELLADPTPSLTVRRVIKEPRAENSVDQRSG